MSFDFIFILVCCFCFAAEFRRHGVLNVSPRTMNPYNRACLRGRWLPVPKLRCAPADFFIEKILDAKSLPRKISRKAAKAAAGSAGRV